MVNNSNQFFNGMRYGNIVMLAFSPFLCKIFSKCWIPYTDIFGKII